MELKEVANYNLESEYASSNNRFIFNPNFKKRWVTTYITHNWAVA